ncbi:MAG: hypothetical protein SFY95_05165 [Planctomycetota bacterium]|nr:hypothetical protein [Planctomycetota bacterium]
MRPERVPQGVDVNRAAAVVGLDDDRLAAATLDAGQSDSIDSPLWQAPRQHTGARYGHERIIPLLAAVL